MLFFVYLDQGDENKLVLHYCKHCPHSFHGRSCWAAEPGVSCFRSLASVKLPGKAQTLGIRTLRWVLFSLQLHHLY